MEEIKQEDQPRKKFEEECSVSKAKEPMKAKDPKDLTGMTSRTKTAIVRKRKVTLKKPIDQKSGISGKSEKTDEEDIQITPFQCVKCEKYFGQQKSLDDHNKRRRMKPCISCWFVCRRCLKSFNQLSDYAGHHNKTLCARYNPGEKLLMSALPPEELLNVLQVRKGAEDCKGLEKYFENAVQRRDRIEIMNALEGMTIAELEVMLKAVAKCDDVVSKIDSLASLSDYSSLKTTSPEKKAMIKPFILEQTRL